MCCGMRGSEDSLQSPSTRWAPGTEIRLSGLEMQKFTFHLSSSQAQAQTQAQGKRTEAWMSDWVRQEGRIGLLSSSMTVGTEETEVWLHLCPS